MHFLVPILEFTNHCWANRQDETPLLYHECIDAEESVYFFVDFDFDYAREQPKEVVEGGMKRKKKKKKISQNTYIARGIKAIQMLCASVENTYKGLWMGRARQHPIIWQFEHGPNENKFSIHVKTRTLCFPNTKQLHLFIMQSLNEMMGDGGGGLSTTQRRVLEYIDRQVYKGNRNLRGIFCRKGYDGANPLVPVDPMDLLTESKLTELRTTGKKWFRTQVRDALLTNVSPDCYILSPLDKNAIVAMDSRICDMHKRLLVQHDAEDIKIRLFGQGRKRLYHSNNAWGEDTVISSSVMSQTHLDDLNRMWKDHLRREFKLTYPSEEGGHAYIVMNADVDLRFFERRFKKAIGVNSNDAIWMVMKLRGRSCPLDGVNGHHKKDMGRSISYSPRTKRFSLLCYNGPHHVAKKASFFLEPLSVVFDVILRES